MFVVHWKNIYFFSPEKLGKSGATAVVICIILYKLWCISGCKNIYLLTVYCVDQKYCGRTCSFFKMNLYLFC